MSIKSTQTISRATALRLILEALSHERAVSNSTLGNILDLLADAGESQYLNRFHNFIVLDERDK